MDVFQGCQRAHRFRRTSIEHAIALKFGLQDLRWQDLWNLCLGVHLRDLRHIGLLNLGNHVDLARALRRRCGVRTRRTVAEGVCLTPTNKATSVASIAWSSGGGKHIIRRSRTLNSKGRHGRWFCALALGEAGWLTLALALLRIEASAQVLVTKKSTGFCKGSHLSFIGCIGFRNLLLLFGRCWPPH